MRKRKHTPTTKWFRTAIYGCVLLISLNGLTACQKQPAETPQGQQQTETGTEQGQTAKPPAAGVTLSPITYSDADQQGIKQTAKAIGVPTVYLPQQGTADDKLDQLMGAGKQLTLKFYKMNVIESAEEIKPSGNIESQNDIKLKIGRAQWITSGGKPMLHLKLEDTYIAIHSDKGVSQDELEAIAETLSPVK